MDPDEEIKIGSPTRGISGLPPEGERVCDDEILLEGSKKNLGIENKKEKEKKKARTNVDGKFYAGAMVTHSHYWKNGCERTFSTFNVNVENAGKVHQSTE